MAVSKEVFDACKGWNDLLSAPVERDSFIEQIGGSPVLFENCVGRLARHLLSGEDLDRLALRESFKGFVERVAPTFIWYKHCEVLGDVLQKVADGEIKRLMIFMPPRAGKSEITSRLFSAYWLSINPSDKVGLCSYAADLATDLSREARDNYLSSGAAAREDVKAANNWKTQGGGGMWSAGIGGPISGKGGQLLIIDDVLKNDEEAQSELVRERHKDWYRSTFQTRLEPGGAIVIIMTRWHEDDLAGWLLEEENKDRPEHWTIVCLPGIAEEPHSFPGTCNVIPDWRKEGETLCEQRLQLAELEKRRVQSPYWFDALYQQRPSAKEGRVLKIDCLKKIGRMEVPHKLIKCRAWDFAGTQNAGDYTVGALLGLDPETGEWYILDIVRGQWGPENVERAIINTAAVDGEDIRIHLPIDPGQGAKYQAELFIKKLRGYIVSATRVEKKNKEARARGFAAQVNAGNVSLVVGTGWAYDLLEEFRMFPNGKHDDQIDACADAFRVLAFDEQPILSEGESLESPMREIDDFAESNYGRLFGQATKSRMVTMV